MSSDLGDPLSPVVQPYQSQRCLGLSFFKVAGGKCELWNRVDVDVHVGCAAFGLRQLL